MKANACDGAGTRTEGQGQTDRDRRTGRKGQGHRCYRFVRLHNFRSRGLKCQVSNSLNFSVEVTLLALDLEHIGVMLLFCSGHGLHSSSHETVSH